MKDAKREMDEREWMGEFEKESGRKMKGESVLKRERERRKERERERERVRERDREIDRDVSVR